MENVDLFEKNLERRSVQRGEGEAGSNDESGVKSPVANTSDTGRIPPWEYDAEKAPNSIWWMMGRSGDYYTSFKAWFADMPADEQAAFTWKYPEPEVWRGFYDGLMGKAEET